MPFRGHYDTPLFICFEIFKKGLKIPVPGQQDKGIVFIFEMYRIDSQININIALVMTAAFTVRLVLNEFYFLVFDGIADNFKEVVESPFAFVIRVYSAIERNAIEVAVLLKIFKKLFKINAPSQRFLGKVDVGCVYEYGCFTFYQFGDHRYRTNIQD